MAFGEKYLESIRKHDPGSKTSRNNDDQAKVWQESERRYP